ncbi:MAG: hypothetical protein ABID61_01965 [Candidatus Micrarchaeota archaeon]
MVKSKSELPIETTYKKMSDKLFSIEAPMEWEARYLDVGGVSQHNMITFRSPKDVQKNSTSPNSLSVQYFDRDGPIELDAQTYANNEASINPGGKTQAKKSDFNGLPGVLAITQDLPFNLNEGQVLCTVQSRYLQNPKNLKLFRISFWYDKTKEKEFDPLFDHMLKSFQFK